MMMFLVWKPPMSCDILTFPAVETNVRGGGGRLLAVFMVKNAYSKSIAVSWFP